MTATPTGPLGLDPLLLEILACPDTHHSPLTVDEPAGERHRRRLERELLATCEDIVRKPRAELGH